MKRWVFVLCLLPATGRLHAQDETAFTVASVVSHAEAFDRPHDIELLGDLAFVPGKGGSLAILDVSNPRSPTLLWHRHAPDDLDDAETVLPLADRLLLGTHDFISIDVSDPSQPVFQGRVVDRTRVSRINGMVRRDNTVFAAIKDGWLDAFDISDPSAPELVDALNVRVEHDIGSPHDVDLFGELAVVPDPRQFGRTNEPGSVALIRVYEQQDLLPARRWQLAGLVRSPELSGANRVQMKDRYVLVACSTTGKGGRLVVVDAADAHQPKQVAWLPFAADDGWGPNGLTIAGNVVFLAGGRAVEAIDISRPEQPKKLASQQFHAELPRGRDSGHDLIYRDGYLYVTGQSDQCLLILHVESERIRKLAEKQAGEAG